MRVLDDEALGRLAEDLAEADAGDDLRLQEVLEDLARAHRRQLVRVAHQNQPGGRGDRREEAGEEGQIHHGELVHQDHVGLQGVEPFLRNRPPTPGT